MVLDTADTVPSIGYWVAGPISDFALDGELYKCFPTKIPSSRVARVNIVNKNQTLFCVSNVCPHQAAPLHKGVVDDIEDIISCTLHGWTFDLSSGLCASNRFVLDVYDVIVCRGVVYVSDVPSNTDAVGTRRNFNGNELVYNPGLGWI